MRHETLARIQTLWPGMDLHSRQRPIEIPNVGRDDLACLFGQLGFTSVAEVGVERGLFSEVLCRAAPDARVYCIDPWQRYGEYRDHVSQGKLEGFYAEARQRLAPYQATLIRGFSTDVARDFPDGSLDAVFIDGNHDLAHVIADLHAWVPKVRRGGVVSGHDWIRRDRDINHHVVQATVAYTQCYQIDPWFVLGRKARRPGEVRDKSRSFMWVK